MNNKKISNRDITGMTNEELRELEVIQAYERKRIKEKMDKDIKEGKQRRLI